MKTKMVMCQEMMHEFASTMMTVFYNAIIPARGKKFQTKQTDHESDDRACVTSADLRF